MLAFLALLGAPYIYEISSLRVKSAFKEIYRMRNEYYDLLRLLYHMRAWDSVVIKALGY